MKNLLKTSCISSLFFLVLGSTIAIASPIHCKVGTIKVEVLADTCYNYSTGKSQPCFSSFNPSQFHVAYEYYKYNQQGKIIGHAFQSIAHNQVVSICTEREDKGQHPYAIIQASYGSGFNYYAVVNATDNIVIQPIYDPAHLGSHVEFCKNGFAPGVSGQYCSITGK